MRKKICLLLFTKLKCNIIDLGKNHKETVGMLVIDGNKINYERINKSGVSIH